VSESIFGIYKAVCGTGVHKRTEFWKIVRQKENMRHKGIWVEKSRHVEAGLVGCTSGVNAAHWLCGGPGAAYSFFDSELAPELVESILPDSAAIAAVQALALLVFLGQLSTK